MKTWTAIAPDVYRSPCERFVIRVCQRELCALHSAKARVYERWVEIRDFGDPAEVTTERVANLIQAHELIALRLAVNAREPGARAAI